ncbi:ABC transporter permease [Paenibacillus sp. Marseille-Q4541]|uniref:ABC transporter permease n=1 Tax=Paenibacillus sp. Marseille-Q4541 TaxID=2831522 RepID=UPI001BADB361|nr:ABC transporter permease [Paenibacillus sp. Marseille-Q4541]
MSERADPILQQRGEEQNKLRNTITAKRLKQHQPRNTRKSKKGTDLAAAMLIPLLVITIWQYAAGKGYISSVFLPAPISIGEAFMRLFATGELFHHLGISMYRALIGFLAGSILGLSIGTLTGFSRKAAYLLDPSIQVLRLVPHLAIAPLIILWFGFGEVSKVVIIVSGAFFPLYINTFTGIRNVDNKLYEVGRVLEFSLKNKLTRLILPAALPNILLGFRLSLAVSWIGLVVAELIGSKSGVGFLINQAKQNSDTEVIFVGIIIFAVVGKLIDSLMRLVEKKYLHYRDSYQG